MLGEGTQVPMVERIELVFPGLQGKEHRVTSLADDKYNCIAWAAGDTNDWWWPTGPGKTFWPAGVPRAVTLDAFRELFVMLGYVVCDSEELESGFEKIAIFANDQGVPKHACRQLSNGRWSSKLGRMEDIEHGWRDLTGNVYGSVVFLMKRAAAADQHQRKEVADTD